jgi:hypothetical protein
MRAALLSITFAIGLSLAAGASAQTSPTVTATCKDGTTFSGTTRKGACHGHKGVATWGTQDATMSPAAAAPAAAATPASKPPASMAPATSTATSPARTPPAAKPAAPGQVWVNTASKVYHCPGTRYYGKTKQGEYMSEFDAKAAGDHPSNGKACS